MRHVLACQCVCDIILLVCVVCNMCLFLCCVVFVQFLLGVTNRNGDQIRQEFLSGKVVSRELWQNTEPCSRCIFFQSAPALRLTCISFLCRAEIVFCTACFFSHWLDYFALAAFLSQLRDWLNFLSHLKDNQRVAFLYCAALCVLCVEEAGKLD